MKIFRVFIFTMFFIFGCASPGLPVDLDPEMPVSISYRNPEYSLAVILLNFGDKDPPLDMTYIGEYVFGRSIEEDFSRENRPRRWYSLNSYFLEVSNGVVSFEGEIFDWVKMERPEGRCYVNSDMLVEYNKKTGVDLTRYERIMAVTHDGCPSNSAWINPSTVNYPNGDKRQWLARVNLSSFSVVNAFTDTLEHSTPVHELLHTFGLGHANALECGDDVVNDHCESRGAMDVFEIMGRRKVCSTINTAHLDALGWIVPYEVIESGRFLLSPYLRGNGVGVLKISIDPIFAGGAEISYLYIEYKTKDGVGIGLSALESGAELGYPVDIDGLLIRGVEFKNGKPFKTYLIDTTPGSLFDEKRDPGSWYQPDFYDSFLLSGKGVMIQNVEILNLGPVGEKIAVEINFK